MSYNGVVPSLLQTAVSMSMALSVLLVLTVSSKELWNRIP